VKNVQHKQEKIRVSYFKSYTQKKAPCLACKGEAEGINKHQKDDVEIVASDICFCNGDKERIRNK